MPESAEAPEIDVHEFARRRATGAAVLDVRQPAEYVEAHVPGALLIPLDELADRLDEVPAAGGVPVVVICRSGARSAVASEFLRANSIESTNLDGGMLAWIEAGFDVEHGPAE